MPSVFALAKPRDKMAAADSAALTELKWPRGHFTATQRLNLLIVIHVIVIHVIVVNNVMADDFAVHEIDAIVLKPHLGRQQFVLILEGIPLVEKPLVLHGTAEGVRQYLKTYFGESSVDEFWEFGGDPGEFNVTVTGLRSDENEAWIRKAVEKAKNVRSVLNNIVFNGGESACEIETASFDVGIAVVIDSVMYD